jgi:DNA-directed RNA polymerase subunit beta
MAYSIANNQLLRKHFAEIKRIIDIPNLIDIQKNSYKRFLQAELPPIGSAEYRPGSRFSLRFSYS